MPNSVSVLPLIGHLYLSGMWFGVVPKMDPRRHVFKRDWTCHQYYITNPKM